MFGENFASLSDLGAFLQQKAGETPLAQSVITLRDAPTADDKAGMIREFYTTCRSVMNAPLLVRTGGHR